MNKNKTIVSELIPTNGRASFYGRAKIVEKNGVRALLSYSTIVASVDENGKIHRHWDGKSHTTSSHVLSFLWNFSNDVKTTKDFYKLPLEWAPNFDVSFV